MVLTAQTAIHLLAAFQLLLAPGSNAEVKTYNVGIWYPTNEETIMALYRPLFEGYLNRAAAGTFKMKVVAVDIDKNIIAEDLIDAKKIDFLFSMAGRIACVERAFDWIVVASARNRILGLEAGAQGTVFYSAKSNSAIKSIDDFKGKRFGLPHIHSSSFYVGLQIVFYGNGYADQLSHILMEKIDVAITASTYIPQKYPEQIPNLVFHGLLNGTSYESQPYPFPTSSWLAPAFSLAASPAVPSAVKAAVTAALVDLDPNSAVAKSTALSNFTTPASHSDVRTAMEQANLFDGGRCFSALGDMARVITCPDGFVRDTDRGLRSRCAQNHIQCPSASYPCFCSPCVPTIKVALFPAEVVLGLAAALFGMNLALVVCWGFGLELAGALRRPARALAKAAGGGWGRRSSLARY